MDDDGRPAPGRARRGARVAVFAAAAGITALAVLMGDPSAERDSRDPAPALAAVQPTRRAHGRVQLTVVDLAGRPIPWARVRADTGRWRVADRRGRVRLALLGRIVTVTAAGYATRRIALAEGARIALRPVRVSAEQWGGGPRRSQYFPVRATPADAPPRWTHDFHELLEFPPALAPGRVVVHTHLGWLVALRRRDGGIAWRRRLGYLAATTPAIAGNTVVAVSRDGQVAAYRLNDGGRRWHVRLGGRSESSPLLMDGRVYLADDRGVVRALDLATGRERWRAQVGAVVKAALAGEGGLVVAADYAECLRALDRADGATRWVRCWPGSRFYATPSIGGGAVVAGSYDGWFHALELATGELRWSFRSLPGARVTSAAAVADGRAFLADDDGFVHAVDLTDGTPRWRWRDPLRPVPGRISGAVTVVGDTVYVARLTRPGEPKLTVGLDLRTGRPRWRTHDGRYTPAVADRDGFVLVGHTALRAWPTPAGG